MYTNTQSELGKVSELNTRIVNIMNMFFIHHIRDNGNTLQ